MYLTLNRNTQLLIKQTTKEKTTPKKSTNTVIPKERPHLLKNSHSIKVITLIEPLNKEKLSHKQLNNNVPAHTKVG